MTDVVPAALRMTGETDDMVEGATRWLSYDDMAVALGITPDSARRLATRHKWPRRMGNDGRALVAVPEGRLQQAHDTGADVSPDNPADVDHDDAPGVGRDARALIGYLERRVGELTDELAAARRVGEEARAEAKEARATAEVLRVQAGQVDVLTALVAAERAHLADARIERDRLVQIRAERRESRLSRVMERLWNRTG